MCEPKPTHHNCQELSSEQAFDLLDSLATRSGESLTTRTSSASSSATEDGGASRAQQTSQLSQIADSQSNDLATRYVKLDPMFTKDLTWTNNPRDLDLHGAFSLKKPNLSSDFNLDCLRPVLKDEDGYEPWILRDANGKYYIWNEWIGRLRRVADHWTTDPGLKTTENIVEHILDNLTFVEDDAVQVFCN